MESSKNDEKQSEDQLSPPTLSFSFAAIAYQCVRVGDSSPDPSRPRTVDQTSNGVQIISLNFGLIYYTRGHYSYVVYCIVAEARRLSPANLWTQIRVAKKTISIVSLCYPLRAL